MSSFDPMKERKKIQGRRISTWLPAADQWMWNAMDDTIKTRESHMGVRFSHGSLMREILCDWCRRNAEGFVPEQYRLVPEETE